MTRSSTRKLTAFAIVVGAVVGIAAARSVTASTAAPSDPGTGSTGSQIQPSPTAEYWTPERMRDAQPAPMPSPNG